MTRVPGQTADTVTVPPRTVTDEEDLCLPSGSLDPYVDTCPPWCERLADGHVFSSSEDDRVHYGTHRYVPVRSLRAEYIQDGRDSVFALGHVSAGVRSRALEAQPSVMLGVRSADLNVHGCSLLEVA